MKRRKFIKTLGIASGAVIAPVAIADTLMPVKEHSIRIGHVGDQFIRNEVTVVIDNERMFACSQDHIMDALRYSLGNRIDTSIWKGDESNFLEFKF